MGWRFAFGVDRRHRAVIVYEALARSGREWKALRIERPRRQVVTSERARDARLLPG
jgi:hypothetical protein